MYKTILLDPPWSMASGGGKSCRGAQNHYPLMRTSALLAMPVGKLVAPSAHMWLWAIDNQLPDALACMKQWGFRYVKSWIWVKTKQGVELQEDLYSDADLKLGLGQYGKACHEQLLFGVKGDTMLPSTSNRPANVFHAPLGRHSQKPIRSYEIIEQVSPAPRLEIFARSGRAGWDAVGNQAPGQEVVDITIGLQQLMDYWEIE